MYKALHLKHGQTELKIKKGAILGTTLLSTSVVVNVLPNIVSADNSKIVAPAKSPASAAPAAPAPAPSTPAQPAAKSQDDINKEALIVIHGDLGNGDERVQKLTAAGYDAPTVQNQVNIFYAEWGWSGAYQVSSQTTQASPAATTQTNSAPEIAGSVVANAPTTDGYVPGTDVVAYAANKMAANTGVSASQWTNVIMAESSGNANAVNSSSGAYGLFQLLGHGEYQGMSVDDQINMATQVYESQGAGAWAETW